jgi:hypothetical protein
MNNIGGCRWGIKETEIKSQDAAAASGFGTLLRAKLNFMPALSGKSAAETRMTKPETRKKPETRMSNDETRELSRTTGHEFEWGSINQAVWHSNQRTIRNSSFGLDSDFGFRHSGFRARGRFLPHGGYDFIASTPPMISDSSVVIWL